MKSSPLECRSKLHWKDVLYSNTPASRKSLFFYWVLDWLLHSSLPRPTYTYIANNTGIQAGHGDIINIHYFFQINNDEIRSSVFVIYLY